MSTATLCQMLDKRGAETARSEKDFNDVDKPKTDGDMRKIDK